LSVCYVSPEFFSWGIHGGFGYVTRSLSTSLADRGFEVSVLTLRRQGQRRVESVNGVKIYGYEPYTYFPNSLQPLASRIKALKVCRHIDADIFHSQAVSYNTSVAQVAAPNDIHVITFQDPYDEFEWRRIAEVEPRYRLTPRHMLRIELERKILSGACHRAYLLYSQARFLIKKARDLFNIRKQIEFLPNPVNIPKKLVEKSAEPSVCFLARWDPQKRVELFLELARMFPEVRFTAMGRGHDYEKDRGLREKYKDVPNLKLTDFVSEEEKSRILSESWALVNTSIREALPVSFLEALAHKTPIISGENPDSLTSEYGYLVKNDDFPLALRSLLQDEDRTRKGEEGRRVVKKIYESNKVVDRHIKIYEGLMERRR
jgi:glycosyltransferase involved in cell wall biosynthesis